MNCHAHQLPMTLVTNGGEDAEFFGPTSWVCPQGCVAQNESVCISCPICADIMAPLVALAEKSVGRKPQ